ncbi:MAG: AAA family ATPase [Candidatus Hodarchaeota archaeon]
MTTRQETPLSPQSLVFRRIRLVNFVIHRDTTIQLDASPVVLITGANGSGKTLILDALLFAIGVDSRRAQKQRNSAFIGRFNKHAEVQLDLNNFVLNGRRVFHSPDKAIAKLLNQDIVTIRLRIHANNRITYWVNEKRTLNGRLITRKDIQKLFQSAGLFGDSPLAVTEAETLDHFASQSPRRKFETLLNETGLRNWMEKLEEARLLVLQAKANVKPLQYRIRHEEQRLEVLKTAYEAFQQKQQLLHRLTELDVEAAWAEVTYREQLAHELQTQVNGLTSQLNREQMQLAKQDDRRAQLISKFEDMEHRKVKLQTTMESLRDQQMQAQGHRVGLENEVEVVKSQLKRYTRAKERKPPRSKEATFQGELDGFLSDRDRLDDQLAVIRQDITATEELLFAKPQRYPRFEETILRACQQFRKELDNLALDEVVIGPLFTLIRMRQGSEQHETAVKLALGRYTYAFIALNRDAFGEAKSLFDRLWPHDKPDLVVARTNPTTTIARDRPPVAPPVFGWVGDLIEGDVYAVSFLSRVVNTAVAEESADANELVDAAQQLKGNIITSDGRSYYLRIGAFARPPRPVTVSLSIPLRELGLLQDVADTRGQLRNLREEEARLMQDRMRINAEISQLRIQLQELRQSSATLSEEEQTSIVTDLENRAQNLHQQILELDTQCDTLGQDYQDCNTELSPINSQLQKLDSQLYNLDQQRLRRTGEIERLNEEIRRREDEYEHLTIQVKEFRNTAKTLGPQPSMVRSPPAIRDEQIQLQAMIETISATATDHQAFQEQEQVVQQLYQYLKDRQLHLENLMTDVDRRLTRWREELETTITTLNHRMNQLLSHFLKQVKLIVRYPDEPSRAELHLQLAINRKGQWRTYQEMSGGERVLATQTFILALHTLAKSPLHVIDEFTQRLDEASRAAVLSIVQRTLGLTKTDAHIYPQFLLMAPSTVGLQIPEAMHHVILLKGQVKTS